MKNSKKGFTLVELLVVIAILSILGAVTIVGYSGFKRKANLAAATTELTTFKTNLMLHDDDYATYEIGDTKITFATDETLATVIAQFKLDLADDFKDCENYSINDAGTIVTHTVEDVTVSWTIATGAIAEVVAD